MKFSYTLLKQLVPAIKSKNELIEKLCLYAFEAEDAGKDTIDIKLPPNRVSDSGGHWGMAREISAVYGRNFRIKNYELRIKNLKPLLPSATSRQGLTQNLKPEFKIKIQDKNLCSRYAGQYFENIKIKPSPKWMQKILISCGMQPINNVVDAMNYAMLETGQPLHAFDFDKISISGALDVQKIKKIIVRKSRKGEKITTLDNRKIELNENVLVIADNKESLAIAGIKGGKKAEVDGNTKRIIVEAANFDARSVYKTSRNLGLITDASLRFSRDLNFELVGIGLDRAGELLKEIIGAKAGQIIDVNFNKPSKKIIKFDIKKFSDFIGLELEKKKIINYLQRLGFTISRQSSIVGFQSFLAEAPKIRQDIETFEDLSEEIIRLFGYNNLKSKPPAVHLQATGFENQIVLKDKIRKILVGFGLNEVQNNSFISQADVEKYKHPELVELENPISAEYQYLRPCLTINFIKNVVSNSRFFDEISLFEIGNIFFQLKKYENPSEVPTLGIVLASKNSETIFRLKGIASEFFKKNGIVDFLLAPAKNDGWIKNAAAGYLNLNNSLKIETENGSIIGYLGKLKEIPGLEGWYLSVFEIDLKKMLEYVEAEREYLPLPKYPSIMRDISMWVDKTAAIGDIMREIQELNLKIIEDVDLIDEYEYPKALQTGAAELKKSLTFRIVFQAEDRTLTDKEVNGIMEKIIAELKRKFQAEIR